MINYLKSGLALALFLFANWAYSQSKRPYFQQRTDYNIQVTLDDEKHMLQAFEQIIYSNNSRKPLDSIYFHLWPNAYKNNETAMAKQLMENGNYDFYYSSAEEKGWIDSLHFKVEGKTAEWHYHPEHIDIAILVLPKRLLPGNSITITTPFRVKLPGDFSRMGHEGQSYQVTQWYPKPAVFDRDGWHEMPYLDQGEFYSEFGSFEVSITLPKNYVVGATGDLQEKAEREWLLDKVSQTEGILKYERDYSFPRSSPETKTITYKQDRVHDFAWFADKRYHVLRGEVELPGSGDTVETWIMYTNREAEFWKKGVKYMNQAIYAYSKWNGDYPYKQATAVYGALSAGGGMEYPNVTVIGASGSDGALETVIVHEVGHNWFQGILGFNERDQPSMDEGINSFNEIRYIEEYVQDYSMVGDLFSDFFARWLNLDGYSHRDEQYLYYTLQARRNIDQPLSLTSEEFTNANYGAVVYAKKALSVQMLRSALGDEVFDRGMQTFFEEWKFKHPSLADWQEVMERVSEQNLSWFFKKYYQSTARVDLKAKKLKRKKGELTLTVKNKGDVAVPFSVTTYTKQSKVKTRKFGAIPFGEKVSLQIPEEGARWIVVDGERDLVDHNRKNNSIKNKGILKKMEPLQLRLFTSMENPNKSQLFLTPLIGWNTADQFMLGIGLHNKSMMEKRFEWFLGPMYSFHRNDLNGIADFSLHFYPAGFQRITANFNVMRFAYHVPAPGFITYTRYYPKLKFDIKPKRERSAFRHGFSAGLLVIQEFYQGDGNPFINGDFAFGKAGYKARIRKLKHGFDAKVDLTLNEDFSQATYELKYHYKYNERNNRISARFFLGHFLVNNTTSPVYNLRMDGQTGFYDYEKNQVFPDREGTHDVWKNQMNENHGAFKTPTALGQSNKWLAAVNLKWEAPLPVPIGLYADMGFAEATDVLYNAGISVRVVRDIFEIYFPVLWSQNILDEYSANGVDYGSRIRFTLNLPAANPYRYMQKLNF